MKTYEIIEHTADVGIRVFGATLKELFENAAKGMFDIIGGKASFRSIRPLNRREIRLKKDVEALEELLVAWLGELLYIFNKDRIFFTEFKIAELNNSGLAAEAFGDTFKSTQIPLQTEIKAVTFHNLKIEENTKGFSCKIIFDV